MGRFRHIIRSFPACGLNILVDGSQDSVINCLKQKEACHAGAATLRREMVRLNKESAKEYVNPFENIEFIDSDIEEATVGYLLVDKDGENEVVSDEDEDINVEYCLFF